MPPRLTQPTGIRLVHEYDTVTLIGCGGLAEYADASAVWHAELYWLASVGLPVTLPAQGVPLTESVIVKFDGWRMQEPLDGLHDAFSIAATVS